MGQVGVAHHGTNSNATVRLLLHLAERQTIDIDQDCRCFHVQLHEVEESGSTGDVARRCALPACE